MAEDNIWIGKSYLLSDCRILVLGESDYCDNPKEYLSLENYVPTWIDKITKDYTFSRIFNACSGKDASSASIAQRREFWNSIIFYNFVTVVLPSRDARPSDKQFRDSKPALNSVLEKYKPNGVWILGIEQSRFSWPVVASHKIPYVIQYHPTSRGLRKKCLQESFFILQALCLGENK